MNDHGKPSIPESLRSRLLGELIQNPFMGINITDHNGRVLFLNRTHQQITGHMPEDYLGRTMEEIAKEGLISESATLIVLATKKPAFINQVSSHRNHFFQVHSVPLKNKAGEIEFVINYLLDASEIVKLQKKISKIRDYNKELVSHNELLQKKLNFSGELIYQSKIMQNVVETASRVAGYEVSVLITGPSGSGKEMLSSLIQSHSRRRNAPFIKLNCAAIPEPLLESELFGYEPGAFTGGSPKGKKGLIESAHTGTLLLDEIGELPLNLQSKLLRVLQTHSLRHIGGSRDIEVDFRLLASTNADLKQMIRERTFREDLYYRLNVIEIAIPGLDQRQEDIILLIDHFLKLSNAAYNLNKSFSKSALRYLGGCSYPGNVRELYNVVQRIVIMSNTDVITLEDVKAAAGYLKPAVQAADLQPVFLEEGLSLKELMGRYEKQVLTAYLKKYKSGAKIAEILQTDQSTISRKISRYQIHAE